MRNEAFERATFSLRSSFFHDNNGRIFSVFLPSCTIFSFAGVDYFVARSVTLLLPLPLFSTIISLQYNEKTKEEHLLLGLKRVTSIKGRSSLAPTF